MGVTKEVIYRLCSMFRVRVMMVMMMVWIQEEEARTNETTNDCSLDHWLVLHPSENKNNNSTHERPERLRFHLSSSHDDETSCSSSFIHSFMILIKSQRN